MKKKMKSGFFAAAFFLSGVAAFAQAPDISRAAAGEMTYSDYCATCHGEQLRNTSDGVTFDLRKLHSGEFDRFRNSVLNGKNNMPPWKGVLSEDQIGDIWSYIRTNAGS